MLRTARLLTMLASCTGSVFLIPAGASGASRLEPPTLMMMDKDNKVAVAVVEPGPREGTATFLLRQPVFAEVPEQWVARLDSETLEQIVQGRPYIVAYTEVRRNPLDRETRELDPEGPRVITLPVVGAALLEDTPELRFLFEAVKAGQEDLGRDYLRSILSLLAAPDAKAQRFAVAELYLRQDLYEALESGDIEVLRSAASSEALGPEPRAMLLEASGRFPQAAREQWPTEVARGIVANAGTELDLDSTNPLLIKTALEVLAQTAVATDAEALARHFGSNSPGVAKAALAALEMLDPDLAAVSAREVLASDDLHPTTRQAMEQFLRRYASGQSGG